MQITKNTLTFFIAAVLMFGLSGCIDQSAADPAMVKTIVIFYNVILFFSYVGIIAGFLKKKFNLVLTSFIFLIAGYVAYYLFCTINPHFGLGFGLPF